MSLRFFHRLGASQLYRRALCGGVRSEAWAGTYGPVPGIGPEAAANAALNVVWGNNATVANLHLVRKIRDGACERAVGWRSSIRCARKIAEQADLHLALQPGTDVLLALRAGRRAGATGRARPRLHRRACQRLRGVHDAGARLAGGEGGRGMRRRARRYPPSRRLDGGGRSAGAGSRQRARARPQRRQRHSCGHRAAGAAGQTRARTTASCSAPATLSRRPRPSCSGPIWCRPEPERSTSSMSAATSSATTSTRRCAPCSSTITIRSSCTPTRTASKRGLAREEIFLVGIEIAMTESMQYCDIVLPAASALRMRRSLCLLWPPLAATSRAGDPAGRRGAAQHRDLSPAGGTFLASTDACFRASDRELMDDAVDAARPAPARAAGRARSRPARRCG